MHRCGNGQTCNAGESKVTVSFFNGPSISENSWEISIYNVKVKEGTQNNGQIEICLADGTYSLKGKDSNGNGWNDNGGSSSSSTITLTDKDGIDIVDAWVGPQSTSEDTFSFSPNVGQGCENNCGRCHHSQDCENSPQSCKWDERMHRCGNGQTCNAGESKVTVSFFNGPSISENSWEISIYNVKVKEGTQNNGQIEICLADGTYSLKGKDSNGNGWNDNGGSSSSSTITLTDKDGIDIVDAWVGPQSTSEDTFSFSPNVGQGCENNCGRCHHSQDCENSPQSCKWDERMHRCGNCADDSDCSSNEYCSTRHPRSCEIKSYHSYYDSLPLFIFLVILISTVVLCICLCVICCCCRYKSRKKKAKLKEIKHKTTVDIKITKKINNGNES
jgi:uncharacterized membrane protein